MRKEEIQCHAGVFFKKLLNRNLKSTSEKEADLQPITAQVFVIVIQIDRKEVISDRKFQYRSNRKRPMTAGSRFSGKDSSGT